MRCGAFCVAQPQEHSELMSIDSGMVRTSPSTASNVWNALELRAQRSSVALSRKVPEKACVAGGKFVFLPCFGQVVFLLLGFGLSSLLVGGFSPLLHLSSDVSRYVLAWSFGLRFLMAVSLFLLLRILERVLHIWGCPYRPCCTDATMPEGSSLQWSHCHNHHHLHHTSHHG